MNTTYQRSWALDSIEISRSHSDGRTVEAYAAIFNTAAEVRDGQGHYSEVISPSAFAKTLAERSRKVGVFYNHGFTIAGTPSELGSVPLGTPVEIRADNRGLFTVTRYNKTALAESVLESIRNGDITAQSFRGRVYQSTPGRGPYRPAGGVLPTVTRTELGLTEYGPTPRAVYEGAVITAVRAEHIVAGIAGLSEEERAELVRMLSSTTPQEPETPNATPDAGAGAEEPPSDHAAHSRRQTDIARRIRMGMVLRGIRNGTTVRD